MAARSSWGLRPPVPTVRMTWVPARISSWSASGVPRGWGGSRAEIAGSRPRGGGWLARPVGGGGWPAGAEGPDDLGAGQDLLVVGLGDAEQVADDRQRQPQGELVDELGPPARRH